MHINEYGNNVCLWSNCDNDQDFINEYKEVYSWMFVGFMIPRNIIDKIGLPRKDFFIYHDDIEYAKRIIKNGFKIIKVKDSIILHNDYANRDSYKKFFLGLTIDFPKMNDWKLYYYIRNYILCYTYSEIDKYYIIFRTLPLIFMRLILLNIPQKKVFFKAYIHGIIGKSGKVMEP